MGAAPHRRRWPTALSLALVIAPAACGGRPATEVTASSPPPASAAVTTTEPLVATTATTAAPPPPSTTPPATTTTAPSTTTRPPTTTTILPAATRVTTPGDYAADDLEIHLTFRSEVDDVSAAEFETTAIGILTDPRGWSSSGFTFVIDDASELTVVLAEPDRVDELCLPLETKGYASCQNGTIVALNAERWRTATADWDTTIEEYRRYLVTHEVGHLIGLRHPVERCPDGADLSAVMEPQTGGLVCAGNGWPLDWEILWAAHRPAVVAPPPEWDGPRPSWP